MTFEEFKKKSKTELEALLTSFVRELFALNVQKAMGELTRFHLIPIVKKNIARVKMLLGGLA